MWLLGYSMSVITSTMNAMKASKAAGNLSAKVEVTLWAENWEIYLFPSILFLFIRSINDLHLGSPASIQRKFICC